MRNPGHQASHLRRIGSFHDLIQAAQAETPDHALHPVAKPDTASHPLNPNFLLRLFGHNLNSCCSRDVPIAVGGQASSACPSAAPTVRPPICLAASQLLPACAAGSEHP